MTPADRGRSRDKGVAAIRACRPYDPRDRGVAFRSTL